MIEMIGLHFLSYELEYIILKGSAHYAFMLGCNSFKMI